MAQAAARLGIPLRLTLAATVTNITGVPVEAAYVRIRPIATSATLEFNATDGAAQGSAYETFTADATEYRAIDQNIQQGDTLGFAGTASAICEITFLRQGK